MRGLTRFARPILVVAAAATALIFMPANVFANVTQELVALFGLMMAAVLPTMVLTASALRGGNLSVRRLTAYRDALLVQLKVWIGLFVVSFVCGVLVMVGKMIDWQILVFIPWGERELHLNLAHGLSALLAGMLMLVSLRVVSVGHGIVSLLRLSAELALAEAKARDAERFAAADKAVAAIKDNPEHGRYVDLKH